jgi:uncharacterized protein YbaR (Trm112 family)
MSRSVRQFVDDRGEPAPMPHLPDFDRIASDVPGLRPLLLELDLTRFGWRKALRPRQIVWLVLSCGLWMAAYMPIRNQPLVFRMAMSAGVIVAIMTSAYMLRRADFWRGLGRVRRVMLEAALCPSCTHALDGLPEMEDGCVVCPECGSAWRVDAITRSLPPVA